MNNAFSGFLTLNHSIIRLVSVPDPTTTKKAFELFFTSNITSNKKSIPCGFPKLPPYKNMVLFWGSCLIIHFVYYLKYSFHLNKYYWG